MKNYHSNDIPHIKNVQLKVSSLKQSLDFYTKVLGLSILNQSTTEASLGNAKGECLIDLIELKDAGPRPQRFAGLYHVALLVPNRSALAKLVQHFIDHKIPVQGASDHGISEAIYLADPDGNGIEIASDTPDDTWPWINGKLDILGKNGPMDIDAVLASKNKDEVFEKMEAETIVGHLHLHTSELEKSKQFYTEILGMDVVIDLPNSALFMSYAGYHHHIALNLWNGRNVPQTPVNAPGLALARLQVPSLEFLREIEDKLIKHQYSYTKKDQALFVLDPSGNPFKLES
ncbi:MAG TPA: glyoxalase [Erysipelotrichaceae bacterium]|nr:glyoxalase [Erysipelotrichaceae bacterium]